MRISNMFRYKCTIFREDKMPVLKISCHCIPVIYKVLRSVAALLLTLIKYKIYNCTDCQNRRTSHMTALKWQLVLKTGFFFSPWRWNICTEKFWRCSFNIRIKRGYVFSWCNEQHILIYRVQKKKAVEFNHLSFLFFNFTPQTMPWYSKWSPRRNFRLKPHFIYDSHLRDECHMLRPSHLLHLMILNKYSPTKKNCKDSDYAIFYVLLLRPSLLGQTCIIRETVGTSAVPKIISKLLEWASTGVITNRWQEKTTITHESIHDHWYITRGFSV
jgi:hypothetical protein